MSISNFYRYVSYVLFFLMLFIPFAFTEIKMFCIVLLVSSGLIHLLLYHQRILISKSIIVWLSLFILHGIFFLSVGVFQNAQLANVLKFSTISVIWPLVFTLLFFFKTDSNYVIKLYKVMEVSVISISIYVIYRVASLLGYLPAYDLYSEGSSVGLMISGGNIELSLPASTTLMFAIPSILSLYLLTKEKRLIPIIVLSMIAIVLTSRRALLLNVMVTPLICWVISVFFLKKKHLKILSGRIILGYGVVVLCCLIIFISLAQLGIFDFREFYSMILEGFDFSGKKSIDPGAQIRAEQYTLLMRSWSERPFFGWGYGAVSEYIIRSDLTPFIYELSYVALLFQTGIFGFLSYLFLIGWIYFKFCKIRNKVSLTFNNYNISILVGLTTFLMANATNPYLYAFDHMWTLFYPLLVLNTLILKESESASGNPIK